MSVDANADVQININATDNASTVVDTATKRINRSWITMRNQQRAVQREFELNNRTLVQTGRLLNTVGSIVQRVISIYNTWQLLQIRNALATKNLRDAQKDLQDIFLEFGGTSREYQEQLERINQAEEEAQRVANETWLVYALMITGIVAQFGRLPKLIPQMKRFSNAVKNLRGGGVVTPKQTTLPTGSGSSSNSIGSRATSAFKNKLPNIKAPNIPFPNLGGKLPAVGGALAGGGASALAFLAGLAGEQNAFAPTAVVDPVTGEVTAGDETPEVRAPESGFGQISQIGSDIEQAGKDFRITVNNFINSPTPQEMIDQIVEQTRQAFTFGNQSAGSQ